MLIDCGALRAMMAECWTAGFLIHGWHARIVGQIFDQIFGQVFDQGFWPGFWGPETTVFSTTGTEKYSFTVLQGQNKNSGKTMQ